ncbi:MAG: hypothetical protein WB588_05050 [Dehalococcoidia bacterium]|jgi:hypothetical protein
MSSEPDMFEPLPQEVRNYFKAIYDEVSWLQLKWDFYKTLYDDEHNFTLVLDLAQTSFIIIEDSLRTDMVMTICRLGDRKEYKSKKIIHDRLTFETLLNSAEINGSQDLFEKYRKASKNIRNSRNATIGHIDLNVAMNLSEFDKIRLSKKDFDKSLEVAWQILNSVYNHFVPNISLFPKVHELSGASQLIYLLEVAQKHMNDLPEPYQGISL